MLLFPPKSNFAAFAAIVTSGDAQDVIYNIEVIYIDPPTTVRTIFPLNTADIKQTTNGIVAKSPKGSVVFPGKTTAKRIVIGTNNNELDKTAG